MAWSSSAIWQRTFRRYETVVVADERQRRACLALLSDSARLAWGRLFGAGVDDDVGPTDYREGDVVVAVRCGDAVVGTARTAPIARVGHLPSARFELGLARIPRALHPAVRLCTDLCIDPRHARGRAAWALIEAVVAEAYRCDARLLVVSCEPSQVALLLDVGFRPLAPMRGTPSGGFRAPMVFVLHDRVHLEDVQSPLRRVLRQQESPLPVEGLRWLFRHQADYADEDLGLAWADAHTPLPHALVDGLSVRGRRALVRGAYRARCTAGQRVVAQGGPAMLGLVERGGLAVGIDGELVAELGPAKVFGPLGVLRGGRSPVEIVAQPDTVLVCLSPDAWGRALGGADRAIVERNLARLATDRAHTLRPAPSRTGLPARSPEVRSRGSRGPAATPARRSDRPAPRRGAGPRGRFGSPPARLARRG